jgi:hypothetical protein
MLFLEIVWAAVKKIFEVIMYLYKVPTSSALHRAVWSKW